MTITTLLQELAQKNIRLIANEDQLGIQAPKGVLTPDIQQSIKARKKEILDWLTAQDGTWDELPALVPNPTQLLTPFPSLSVDGY